MPTPPVARARAEAAVALVEQMLRDGCVPRGVGGGRSSIQAAANAAIESGLVRSKSGFESLIEASKLTYGLEPDWSLHQPYRYQQPVARLDLVPAAAPRPPQLSGIRRRVLVIPDRHNDPRHPHRLEASTWIARFGSELRADDVVCLGDAGSWDSCSRHDRNDTFKGRMKPGIRDDLANMEAQEVAFERGRASDWKPRKHKCRGNHEQRLFDFENQHPESEGTHTHRYMQTLLQFGWRERAFGEIFFLSECGFTHAPINGMGKPMGGKTVAHRAGDMLTNTLFHGHTHKRSLYDAAKSGLTDCISVVSPGCALPWGEIEHYAAHNPTGWWWGVAVADLIDGQAPDINFVSMLHLRDRYSDDGADKRAA